MPNRCEVSLLHAPALPKLHAAKPVLRLLNPDAQLKIAPKLEILAAGCEVFMGVTEKISRGLQKEEVLEKKQNEDPGEEPRANDRGSDCSREEIQSSDTCVDAPRKSSTGFAEPSGNQRPVETSCFVKGLCCMEQKAGKLGVDECVTHGRGNQWTRGENVLLVGAVFMVLSERGSLFPSTRKGKRVGYYTKQGGSDTWDRVKEIFDDMKKHHATVAYKERSPTALSRHYKFLRGTPGMEGLVQEWLECCGNQIIGDPSRLAIATIGSNDGWTVHEDVVLVAAVFERFFRSGNRCGTALRDELASWFEIKSIYDLAWTQLKITKPCERNIRQLHTRYKKMKRALKKIHGECQLKTYIQAYRWFLQGCTLQSAPVQLGKRKRVNDALDQPISPESALDSCK